VNDDDGDERERLLRAKHEVTETLRRHDLCAHVLLIGPSNLEVMVDFDATWSNLSFITDADGNRAVGLRSHAADYQGKAEQRQQDLEATVGMVRAIASFVGIGALSWMELAEAFDKATGAEHTLVEVYKQ
jgi:hypothetical protein